MAYLPKRLFSRPRALPVRDRCLWKSWRFTLGKALQRRHSPYWMPALNRFVQACECFFRPRMIQIHEHEVSSPNAMNSSENCPAETSPVNGGVPDHIM